MYSVVFRDGHRRYTYIGAPVCVHVDTHTAVHLCPAPRRRWPRRFGTARKLVPSGRFRKDGRDASKLATGGRRQNKYSCHWRSRHGETNEAWWPSAGPSGARGTCAAVYPQENKTFQILESTRLRTFLKTDFHGRKKHRSRRAFFTRF